MKKWMFTCWALFLLGLTACENEANTPLALNTNSIQMHYNDTETLILSFGDDRYAEMEYVWTSSDENVATVSQLGVVSGVRIGECVVTVSSTNKYYKASCEVQILPISKLYEEPVLKFGSDMNIIKTGEPRTLIKETETTLTYTDPEQSIQSIVYSFEENQLTNIEVLFNTATAALREEIMTYLEERYALSEKSQSGREIFEIESGKKQAIFHAGSLTALSVVYLPEE